MCGRISRRRGSPGWRVKDCLGRSPTAAFAFPPADDDAWCCSLSRSGNARSLMRQCFATSLWLIRFLSRAIRLPEVSANKNLLPHKKVIDPHPVSAVVRSKTDKLIHADQLCLWSGKRESCQMERHAQEKRAIPYVPHRRRRMATEQSTRINRHYHVVRSCRKNQRDATARQANLCTLFAVARKIPDTHPTAFDKAASIENHTDCPRRAIRGN